MNGPRQIIFCEATGQVYRCFTKGGRGVRLYIPLKQFLNESHTLYIGDDEIPKKGLNPSAL